MNAEAAITQLLREIETYLAAFDHAGVRAVRDGLARWGNGPHHRR
jgi:hypothetical protein